MQMATQVLAVGVVVHTEVAIMVLCCSHLQLLEVVVLC